MPLTQTGKHRKKALVIISDGNDTSSVGRDRRAAAPGAESEVLVYAIGIDGHGEPAVGRSGPRYPSPGPGAAADDPVPDTRPGPGSRTRRRGTRSRRSRRGGWRGGYGRNDDRVNVSALRALTDDSGGRTEVVRDARDLDPATAGIADELSQQVLPGVRGSRTAGRPLAPDRRAGGPEPRLPGAPSAWLRRDALKPSQHTLGGTPSPRRAARRSTTLRSTRTERSRLALSLIETGSTGEQGRSPGHASARQAATRPRMASKSLAFVVGAILTAGMARAGTDHPDPRLFNEVAGVVRSYPSFTIFDDVDVDVSDGVVTLTGHVTKAHTRADIETRVQRVSGVQDVHNGIKVLPASQFDRDLRYRVARAIYGDPRFYHYASMANPPIRIVVENGRVTLTGVVASEVERVLARSLASGNGALSLTCALRTNSEVRTDRERIR